MSKSVYECPRCYLKRRNAASRGSVMRKAVRDWAPTLNGTCVGCGKGTAMVTRPGRYADWPILPMPGVA